MVLEEGADGHMITIYDHGSLIPLLWTHLIPPPSRGGRCTTSSDREELIRDERGVRLAREAED